MARREVAVRVDGALLDELEALAARLGHGEGRALLASRAVTEFADKNMLFPGDYPVSFVPLSLLRSRVELSSAALDELDVVTAREAEATPEDVLHAALRWARDDLRATLTISKGG